MVQVYEHRERDAGLGAYIDCALLYMSFHLLWNISRGWCRESLCWSEYRARHYKTVGIERVTLVHVAV